VEPPARQRAPFGWHFETVAAPGPDQLPLVLAWGDLSEGETPTAFRLAVALDERDEKVVEAALPGSGRVVGTMDLRFVTQFQLYELPLSPEDAAAVRREGLALRLLSGSDLEVFTGGPDLPDAFVPHLLLPGEADPLTEFFARMDSLACIQQFGWMEGCVLDGLLDLAGLPAHAGLRRAAERHLDLFFHGKELVYENHLSEPSDGHIYGIEGTLPFAALARLHPDHPALDLARDFWLSRRDGEGAVIDGRHTTSEGAYTVGYPMALLGRARGDEELERLALLQLRLRSERLFDGFDGREFWRVRGAEGGGTNRNWARGVAWQLLGMARTLAVLRDRPDAAEVVLAFVRLADWARGQQRRADGQWSVFVDEPELTPDAGGSAGIAAALAIGAREGWLGADARRAAEHALDGLKVRLTPDGFLGGVSQSNKGGEGLQRGPYRSLFQMGMGLLAQLIAALGADGVPCH
jgi:hypothetical protein